MGKLGKPQKSKKHKKLKSTFDSRKQNTLLTRFSGQKLHNLRPDNEDDQEIPRKVKDIMKFQTDLKSIKKKKKKKQKFNNEESFRLERGMSRPMKPAPKFVQGEYEEDREFMERVNNETAAVLIRSELEDKYKVDLIDNDTEEGDIVTRRKGKSDKKKEKDRERKKKKAQARKEKMAERRGDFSQFTDHIQFGEVADQPPLLTAKPRKAAVDNSKPRPGKRELLLKGLITPAVTSEDSGPQSSKKTPSQATSMSQRKLGQTVKRKFLSPVQQRITDSQRKNAIDLYRKLKNKKTKKS